MNKSEISHKTGINVIDYSRIDKFQTLSLNCKCIHLENVEKGNLQSLQCRKELG